MSAAALTLAPVLLAQVAILPSPAPSSVVQLEAFARDVAEVSTDVCYRLGTGELRWTPRDLTQEEALLRAAGLTQGIPNGALDSLGPVGKAGINRAMIASRSRGDYHVILAIDGQIPGCRVMLVGESQAGLAQDLVASLVAAGWTEVSPFASKSGSFEQRLFVRNGPDQAYKLDFAFSGDPASKLRVLIGVERASPTSAQQARPDVQIIAQAHDRCLATHAVQLTKTAATDEAIYTQASKSCLGLKGKLTAAIEAQQPSATGTELLRSIDAQGRPNFMAMLAQIRRDRTERTGK